VLVRTRIRERERERVGKHIQKELSDKFCFYFSATLVRISLTLLLRFIECLM